MTLRIERISFTNFRSYQSFELTNPGLLTIFEGANAVGKTNIIEGVQLLTALTSFRHPTIEQLIKQGCASARAEADFSDGNRELTLAVTIEGHAKRYTLNGKPKRPADLKGLMPSVTFTPDDLDLVKGSMSVRRTALDVLGSQLSANHYLIKKDYETVIRHKNKLLKDEAPQALVDAINEQLITVGAQLTCYRAALFQKLEAELAACYSDISSGAETLCVAYLPSWADENAYLKTPTIGKEEAREALAAALEVARAEERARHRALVGPHADRIEFEINGRNAHLFGSQGQQRSVVLAWKLAEAHIIETMLRQKPVLLLDDVMSELDATRRAALVEYIAADVQTFITTANIAYFDEPALAHARVVSLPRGKGEGSAQ